MTNRQFEKAVGFFVREVLRENENLHYFEFDYKHGKGHFKINTEVLLSCFNQTEFKKVVSMMESNDNPQIIAGYLNSIIKRIYDLIKEVNAGYELKHGKPDDNLVQSMEFLAKRNSFLVSAFGVSDITIEKIENSPVTEINEAIENEPDEPTKNELITPLKKCNVIRFIPTQLNPIWKCGLIKSYVGYHFEYRGLPLQVYREDGWETKAKTEAHVFVIDPVIGLPVVSYYGLLAELEDKLSEVFIGYLKTLDSNKESIVQIAKAFETLKKQTNNMTA